MVTRLRSRASCSEDFDVLDLAAGFHSPWCVSISLLPPTWIERATAQETISL